MEEQPKFYGLTVDEHIEYIKNQHDTFEKKYIMVERLLAKIRMESKNICQEAEKQIDILYRKLGFSSKLMIEHVRIELTNNLIINELLEIIADIVFCSVREIEDDSSLLNKLIVNAPDDNEDVFLKKYMDEHNEIETESKISRIYFGKVYKKFSEYQRDYSMEEYDTEDLEGYLNNSKIPQITPVPVQKDSYHSSISFSYSMM